MDDLVQLTSDKDVAIITINNPPVNALSSGVAQGIAQAIEQVGNDDAIKAVVLIGGGRTFIAGADIKEFGKITSGKTQRGAGLLPLLLQIEDVRKPVVVAIHGICLRWRPGIGDGWPLSRGGSECPAGPARSEARDYSRRRRHAALPRLVGVAKPSRCAQKAIRSARRRR